jgi:transposase
MPSGQDHRSGGRAGRTRRAGRGPRRDHLARVAAGPARRAPWLGPPGRARYRRLARRRGKAKALVAVGNTQLKVYHALLSSPGARHADLGPDYYERQASTRRQIAHHVSKLGALGFEVTLCRTPGADPDPSEPGNTQAA